MLIHNLKFVRAVLPKQCCADYFSANRLRKEQTVPKPGIPKEDFPFVKNLSQILI